MLKLLLQGYWKRAISNRFRNERKRHERNNPLAQRIKKVKTDEDGAKEKTDDDQAKEKTDDDQAKEKTDDNQAKGKKSKGKSMYGIKNYLPSRPDGEDNDTIKMHVKMLKDESKKDRQDVRMIQELMDLTLADRREGIVNNNWTVAKVREEYPCLFNKDEVSLMCKKTNRRCC